MSQAAYIHGTDPEEQARLAKLGDLTDAAFVQFVQVKPTDRVLDVGSGLGNVARRVAQAVTRGEVIGIEQSPEQLHRARADLLANLNFRQGDAHDLPFADSTFDVVYCRYLLEHVAQPLQVLKEMHRVLKPGGQTFLQENNILIHATDPDCPAFEQVWRRFGKLQQQLGGDAEIGKRLFHLLCQAGFAEIALSIHPEVHPYGSPGFAPWIKNLQAIVRSSEAELARRGLATLDETRTGIAELNDLLQNNTASAYFYWNRAVGTKA